MDRPALERELNAWKGAPNQPDTLRFFARRSWANSPDANLRRAQIARIVGETADGPARNADLASEVRNLIALWTLEYLNSLDVRRTLVSGDAEAILAMFDELHRNPSRLIANGLDRMPWPESWTPTARTLLHRISTEALTGTESIFRRASSTESQPIRFAPAQPGETDVEGDSPPSGPWVQSVEISGRRVGWIQITPRRDLSHLEYGEITFHGDLPLHVEVPGVGNLFEAWLTRVRPSLPDPWRTRLSVQRPPEFVRSSRAWIFALEMLGRVAYLEQSAPALDDPAALNWLFRPAVTAHLRADTFPETRIAAWIEAVCRTGQLNHEIELRLAQITTFPDVPTVWKVKAIHALSGIDAPPSPQTLRKLVLAIDGPANDPVRVAASDVIAQYRSRYPRRIEPMLLAMVMQDPIREVRQKAGALLNVAFFPHEDLVALSQLSESHPDPDVRARLRELIRSAGCVLEAIVLNEASVAAPVNTLTFEAPPAATPVEQ